MEAAVFFVGFAYSCLLLKNENSVWTYSQLECAEGCVLVSTYFPYLDLLQ